MNQENNSINGKTNSLKKVGENYFYNTLLTVLVALFPIITTPYVARILGPTGLGKVTFAFSLGNYFIILVSLGLPYYGLREISKIRDDQEQLNEKFSEFLSKNFIALLIFGFLYIVLVLLVNRFRQEELLYLIVGIAIVLSVAQVQWFYQGMENFRFIAFANIAMQIISIILIFSLIKSENDYVLYALAILIAFFGGGIVNILYTRKHVHFKFTWHIKLQDYKPFIYLYVYIIVLNVYLNLDKVLLGFMTGDKYVGYYTPANQVIRIVVVFVTSISTVLLPRVAGHIKNKNEQETQILVHYSFNFVLMIAIPAVVGLVLLAPEIIDVFSGPKFGPSVIALQIMAPIVLFTGISNFLVLLILIPRDKEKELVLTTVLGAIVDITANILLIPAYQHVGTATAILLTELAVAISQILITRRYLDSTLRSSSIPHYIIGSGIIALVVLLVKEAVKSSLLIMGVSITIALVLYFGYLLMVKEKTLKAILGVVFE